MAVTHNPGVFVTNPKRHSLSALDEILRLTGDLAQPEFVGLIAKFVSDYTNVSVSGVSIQALPTGDLLWWDEGQLTTTDLLAGVPTALNRMPEVDALALILYGAQSATHALYTDVKLCERVKENTLSLVKGYRLKKPIADENPKAGDKIIQALIGIFRT